MLCLVALAVGRPGWADPAMVAADLQTCSTLNQLGLQLQKSGDLMEKWVSGGLTSVAAREQLTRILEAFRAEEAGLAQRRLPASAHSLQAGAVACASKRRKALEQALTLTEQPKLSLTQLKSYWRATLETTRLSQRDWFRARQGFVGLALKGQTSRPVLEFYTWQASILKIWTEEAEISAEAQLLLIQDYDSDGERKRLEQSSYTLMARALALRGKTELIRPSSLTRASQGLALEEQLALVRVCEAIHLLYQDPSEDSVSRLRHAIRQLSGCSAKLEESSLAALKTAQSR